MTNCPPTCLAAQPLATDFERGRHLMLSSQSISPRRWFTYRLSVPATALLVSSTALSVTVRWGSHWLHPASGPGADLGQWSSALDFDALAPVYPMLTLTAFALGALVGLLLHRAIPALGLTFLLYAALGWGLEQVRPFLLPLHLVVGQVDARMSDSSWIYDEGVVLNGRRVSYQACMDGGCHGAPAWVCFHPLTELSPMLWIASGILAVLTAVLVVASYRRLRALAR